MLRKGLILLNIIILLLSLCFLLMGGLFQCSTSYTGKFYGSLASAASMVFMIFVYLLSIPAKNNGKFPLSEFYIFLPVIITILSILLTTYNIKKHKKDIMSNKANTNYYLYNGLYVLTLGFIIIFQIFNLIMNLTQCLKACGKKKLAKTDGADIEIVKGSIVMREKN